jgi:hypothetical protein
MGNTGTQDQPYTSAGIIVPGQSYVAGTANTRRPTMAMGGDGDSGLVTPTNSDVRRPARG